MKRSILGLLASTAVLAVCAGPAHAAPGAPAHVTVEVAGANATLVPQTVITTTTTPVKKDGTNACTGTSALGALDVATGGNWNGTYNGGFGSYTVEVIKGESHTFSSPAYWSFYVNGLQAQSGVCGVELQTGDRVQFYPACSTGTTGCYGGEPMQLTAPATAKPGVPFSIKLTESTTTYGGPPDYASSTAVAPSSGATVAGATTGADGTAQVTLTTPGPQVITATKGNRPPATAQVCVTSGSDGYCGTTKPGDTTTTTPTPTPTTPTPPIVTPPAPDRTPGVSKLTSIAAKQVFAKGKGPTTIAGTADGTGSAVKWVKVRILRQRGKACTTFSGKYEKFVRAAGCAITNARWFVGGTSASWSYLLPSRLPSGSYTLETRVTDAAGNLEATSGGANRISFTVR